MNPLLSSTTEYEHYLQSRLSSSRPIPTANIASNTRNTTHSGHSSNYSNNYDGTKRPLVTASSIELNVSGSTYRPIAKTNTSQTISEAQQKSVASSTAMGFGNGIGNGIAIGDKKGSSEMPSMILQHSWRGHLTTSPKRSSLTSSATQRPSANVHVPLVSSVNNDIDYEDESLLRSPDASPLPRKSLTRTNIESNPSDSESLLLSSPTRLSLRRTTSPQNSPSRRLISTSLLTGQPKFLPPRDSVTDVPRMSLVRKDAQDFLRKHFMEWKNMVKTLRATSNQCTMQVMQTRNRRMIALSFRRWRTAWQAIFLTEHVQRNRLAVWFRTWRKAFRESGKAMSIADAQFQFYAKFRGLRVLRKAVRMRQYYMKKQRMRLNAAQFWRKVLLQKVWLAWKRDTKAMMNQRITELKANTRRMKISEAIGKLTQQQLTPSPVSQTRINVSHRESKRSTSASSSRATMEADAKYRSNSSRNNIGSKDCSPAGTTRAQGSSRGTEPVGAWQTSKPEGIKTRTVNLKLVNNMDHYFDSKRVDSRSCSNAEKDRPQRVEENHETNPYADDGYDSYSGSDEECRAYGPPPAYSEPCVVLDANGAVDDPLITHTRQVRQPVAINNLVGNAKSNSARSEFPVRLGERAGDRHQTSVSSAPSNVPSTTKRAVSAGRRPPVEVTAPNRKMPSSIEGSRLQSTGGGSRQVSSVGAPSVTAVQPSDRKQRLEALSKQAQERVALRQKLLQDESRLKERVEEEKLAQLRADRMAEIERQKTQSSLFKAEQAHLKVMLRQADMHYCKQLLIRAGFAPWRRLVEQARQNEENAVMFNRSNLLEMYWNKLASYYTTIRNQRARQDMRNTTKALHFRSLYLLKLSFRNWRKYKKILRAKSIAVSSQLNRFSILKFAIRAWRISYERQQRRVAGQMRAAWTRGRINVLRYYWREWVTYHNDQLLEREIQARTDMTWAKVQGWLASGVS